ncbi:MAG: deoxyribonuclease IV [Myxococcota bacterium]
MTKPPIDLFGCHVSIAGGVQNAPQRARALNCNVMQIFTANQRQWRSKPISDSDAEQYKQNLKKFGIVAVMSHDSYLINLCASDPENLNKSVAAFHDEIERCKKLGIELLNFHPGSHLGAGEEAGIKQVANSLKSLLPDVKGTNLKFILENTAGQGSNLGYKFEHLAEIIELVGAPEYFGVCFDTCHGFAAGYEISNEKGWNVVWEEFDRVIGLKFLKAIHVNDSKGALGKKLDRHEHIGKGTIGEEGFRLLVNDPRFKQTPMFLETPEGDDWYIKNLAVMRKLVGK